MKHILIVDIDSAMLDTFAGLIKSQSGFFDVFPVNGVKAALDLMAAQPIDLVITGLHLPEIGGLELMLQVSRNYPEVPIIISAHHLSPRQRAKIKQIPKAVYFKPSLDAGLLARRIFTELGIDYGGRMRGVSLQAFLQMIELERRSCILLVQAKGKEGYLYMVKGELVSATCNGLTGTPAALEILTWEHVTVDVDYSLPETERDVTKSLMGLIMESGHLIDDAHGDRSNQRRYDRYECQVALDFDVRDWTYHCCLRDISHGGAYVETEQPIDPGQKILLTLPSQNGDGPCAVNGTVARRDDKGLAIVFEQVSLYQKNIIETLILRRGAPVGMFFPDDGNEAPSD
jgi:CheY-like chemotaxis protein